MQTLMLASLALATLAAPINASLDRQADDETCGTGDWKAACDMRDDVESFFHRAEGRPSAATLQGASSVALADAGIAFDGDVVAFDRVAYEVEGDTLRFGRYGQTASGYGFQQSLTVTLS
jgi:hypothetical protein